MQVGFRTQAVWGIEPLEVLLFECKDCGSPVEVEPEPVRFTAWAMWTVKCPTCGDREAHNVPPPVKNLTHRV